MNVCLARVPGRYRTLCLLCLRQKLGKVGSYVEELLQFRASLGTLDGHPVHFCQGSVCVAANLDLANLGLTPRVRGASTTGKPLEIPGRDGTRDCRL